jgi:hypothetical protein
VLALADAAITNLATRKPAAAAGAALPGKLLQQHNTRLALVSQLPLLQLLDELRQLQQQQPGTAAAAPVWQGLAGCHAIAVPPLRARASDIVPLALQSGCTFAALRGYSGGVQLSEAAANQLTSYGWPGNEAELTGAIQSAIMRYPSVAAGLSSRSCSSLCSSMDGGCASSGNGGGSTDAPVLVLDAGDFWLATQQADRARIDVLEVFRFLRAFLNTGQWRPGCAVSSRAAAPSVSQAVK